MEITNTTNTVIFAAPATVANTFTATQASTSIMFAPGEEYIFTNINLNGQAAETRITMTGIDPDVWVLTVTGTQNVSYVDVEYSDAEGGGGDRSGPMTARIMIGAIIIIGILPIQ